MSKQPHFVFFITDQHRADWLGCYGHPVVKTSNIDAIAKQGTRFDNFHVANPVCMPNRASLLTGRYPSVHGLRHNGCILPRRAVTFVDQLAEHGYKTAAIGKSHLQPFTGLSPLTGESTKQEAWRLEAEDYTLEEPPHYVDAEHYEFPTPYYGYQHVDMVTGHGTTCGGHYAQWLKQQRPHDWQALLDPANQMPHDYTCPQAERTQIPEELYPTAYIREQAKAYLADNLSSEQPTFTFISFPDPHHPWNPPGKYWDMYQPDQFQVPLKYEDHKNPPRHLSYWRKQFDDGSAITHKQQAFMASEQNIKEAMALSAGMVTMIDDAIGEVMEVINASGQKDNTVVCFTADHGDYLGDYNMLLKGGWLKESICRVPFIWADPQQQQMPSTDTLASTVDIAATILGRAGIETVNGNQGHSLLTALQQPTQVRDSLLIEENDPVPRYNYPTPARVRQVLKDNWSLTLVQGDSNGELYNRNEDPNECDNLWDHPLHQAKQAEMVLALSHLLIQQMDESPKAQRYA